MEEKIVYWIIKKLTKYLSIQFLRGNVRSLTVNYTKDGISGHGGKYYILDYEPYAINDCEFISKRKNKI